MKMTCLTLLGDLDVFNLCTWCRGSLRHSEDFGDNFAGQLESCFRKTPYGATMSVQLYSRQLQLFVLSVGSGWISAEKVVQPWKTL